MNLRSNAARLRCLPPIGVGLLIVLLFSFCSPAMAADDLAAVPAVTSVDAAPVAEIDSGDTAWILTSTALVLFMTIPGLALFYGGLVLSLIHI